jgi:simple sugar transport system ATP-binding protein
MMGTVPMVEMKEITKGFPGVVANDRISLQVHAGEIHGLLGENGAGKSTLMSILTGLYRPDQGEIWIKGERVEFASPRDAVRLGIGMVHQHFKLVKPFTVTENIMLGLAGLEEIYNTKAIEEKIVACSRQYGLKLDPRAKIWQISVGEQQRVEIVRMLFRGAEILILDEPTAVLTPQETGELYKTLRQMAADGKAVIVISHKLAEVMENTDSITVLRGGRRIGTVKTRETSPEELARMMVGRDVILDIEKDTITRGPRILEMKQVTALNDRGLPALKNLSLSVHEGEILGIAGVAGNGQKELAEVIAGLRTVESGKILFSGEDHTASGPRKMNDGGVSYIPEDRMTTGLVPNLNASENMILKGYRKLGSCFIHWKKVRQDTEDIVRRFEVKLADTDYPVKMMSGGNLQKLLLAREIEANLRLMVAVYPMRGLDVGATQSIRQMLLEQRASGKAVLLISEELDELFALSDRLAVIHGGEIMGVVNPVETTVETIGLMMAGQRMMDNHGC